jgi:hypothetical protein
MKARGRINNGDVRRTRTTSYDRWFAKEDRPDPIESLRKDQKNLLMSLREGLIDVNH